MDIYAALFWGAWALVFYTYLLFPLLLAFFARRLGRPGMRDVEDLPTEDLPRVAMVVAAYNEVDVLLAKLANTWRIDYPEDRFTLYIGSDGSDDGTAALLQSYHAPRLHAYVFPKRRGKISVLNDLMREVDAEIVVMSDASTMYEPDAVRKLVRHFRDPRVGCVTGELSLNRDGVGEGAYLRYERWIKRNEGRLGCVIGCVGAIFAIRRDLYEPLPASTIVEDFVLCMRVLERGWQARSEPQARASDPPCPTARAEMGRKVRIGAGAFQALCLARGLLHPRRGRCAFAFWGHKVIRWVVPHLLLLAFSANLILLDSSFYRLLLGMQVGGMLIAWWTYQLPPWKHPARWTRPISYFYLMNYALFRGFLRFLLGTQRVTWERADPVAAYTPDMAVISTRLDLPSERDRETVLAAVHVASGPGHARAGARADDRLEASVNK